MQPLPVVVAHHFLLKQIHSLAKRRRKPLFLRLSILFVKLIKHGGDELLIEAELVERLKSG